MTSSKPWVENQITAKSPDGTVEINFNLRMPGKVAVVGSG